MMMMMMMMMMMTLVLFSECKFRLCKEAVVHDFESEDIQCWRGQRIIGYIPEFRRVASEECRQFGGQ